MPRFGASLPGVQQIPARAQAWEREIGGTQIVEAARMAERAGFDWVSCSDHVAVPVSRAAAMGASWFDAGSTLAFVAGATTRIRLLSHVLVLPYRHPLVIAKQYGTLDHLSGGRLILGVGSGHLRPEFKVLGADFERRGTVSDEYIRIFKTLWTQDPASFEGEFYRFEALRCLPQPVQKPHPPIWIGGHSAPALRRAARLGDGWHPVGANPAVPLRPAELRASLDQLFRMTEAEGRDPSALTISFKAPVYDPSVTTLTGSERRPFSGTPQQIADDIGAYEKAGVSELVFDFRSERLDDALERMERFAQTIR